MPHVPLVCAEDAITACELIVQFTLDRVRTAEYAAVLNPALLAQLNRLLNP